MNRLTPLAAARIAPWRSGPRRQVADAVRRKPAPQMTWFAPLELKIVTGVEGKQGEGGPGEVEEAESQDMHRTNTGHAPR